MPGTVQQKVKFLTVAELVKSTKMCAHLYWAFKLAHLYWASLRNLPNINVCQAYSFQKALLKRAKSYLQGKGTRYRLNNVSCISSAFS